VRTLPRLLCSATLLLAACHGKSAEAPAPELPARPLAALAGQRVVLTPTYRLREADVLGWTAQIPRSREYLRALDDSIAAELAARGLKTQWVYPADLAKSMRGNPGYAADPYALAEEPLRNPAVAAGAKIGDPLVTQLRTMVALHDARMVVMPIEVRFERNGAGQGIAVLRVALIDGRLGEVRWISDVKSDPSPELSRALLASLAGHFADMITRP
jgi:hypothetical protein